MKNQITIRQLRAEIINLTIKILSPREISEKQKDCVLIKDETKHIEVGYNVFRRGGSNIVQPGASLFFREPARIHSAVFEGSPKYLTGGGALLGIGYTAYKKNNIAQLECETVDDVPALQKPLDEFLLGCIFPLFDKLATPTDLIDLYLKDFDSLNQHTIPPFWDDHRKAAHVLVHTRLYRPEYYEKFKKRFEPLFENLIEMEKVKAIRLIEYLDHDELPPLPTPEELEVARLKQ